MSNSEEKNQAKYGIIVEIDDLVCLADNDKLKELFSGLSLKGNILSNVCLAQSDDNSLGMVKKFYLEYEEDFKPFAEAIINIDGVKNIRKDDGPWKRTRKERKAYFAEKEKIQQEKEKRIEEFQKKRQADFDEFNKLREESKKRLDEKFGPGNEPHKITWEVFDKLIPQIGNCQVEFYFVLSDPILGGFMEYKRESCSCNSIDEVLDFYTKCINENLIVFVSPIPHVREIPVNLDLRRNNGKIAFELGASCGKFTFQIGFYTLLVAEN